jgi:hypothetical protein
MNNNDCRSPSRSIHGLLQNTGLGVGGSDVKQSFRAAY